MRAEEFRKQPLELGSIELHRSRLVLMAGFDVFNKPLGSIFEERGRLALRDADFALGQGGTIGRFYLASDAGIALLGALLYVLTVEEEVIPVHAASFEYRHAVTLPFLNS